MRFSLEVECFSGGAFPLERGLQRFFLGGEELLFGYLEKREGRTRELEFSLRERGRRGRGEKNERKKNREILESLRVERGEGC